MANNNNSEPKVDPLDVENNYDILKDLTFPTAWISLDRTTAQTIIDKYDDRRFGSSKVADDHPLLKKLEQSIDDIIQNQFGGSDVFIRLSTRSPKDVALKDTDKMAKILREELESLGVPLHPIEYNDNDNLTSEGNKKKMQEDMTHREVIGLIRACVRALKVNSGEEAVFYFTRSERVYQDLFRRILDSTSETFNMKIIIRKWVNILPEYEFRGFVYNNHLNAVSQYYKACFVPELYQNREVLSKRILEFWETSVKDRIRNNLFVTGYVVDFAVTDEKIYVVELNHWGTTASSALFDWKTDFVQLHHGPYELRVLSQVPANVKRQIAKPLRELIGWSDPNAQIPEPPPEDISEPIEDTLHLIAAKFKNLFSKQKGFQFKFKNQTGHFLLLRGFSLVKLDELFGLKGLYLLDKNGYGFFEFSQEFHNAIGSIKKINSGGSQPALTPTLIALILFEIAVLRYQKDIATAYKPEQLEEFKEAAEKCYLFVEEALYHDDVKIHEWVHNTLILLENEFKLLKKDH